MTNNEVTLTSDRLDPLFCSSIGLGRFQSQLITHCYLINECAETWPSAYSDFVENMIMMFVLNRYCLCEEAYNDVSAESNYHVIFHEEVILLKPVR